MSQENVEIVRQVIEANRSDDLEAGIETAVALSDPNVEFTSIMAAVEPETYRGHDGVRRYFRELAESWEEWRFQTEEVFDAGSDTVVAVFHTRLIGKDSGVAVDARRAMVCVVAEGKFLRGHVYPSREEALEAVGLREWAMSQENVEIVRQSNEAFDRRDRAAFIALHSDDFEIVPAREFPESGVIHGPNAAWDFYVQLFLEAFQAQTPYSDMAELSDAGDDKVLQHNRGRVRGGASGAEIETETWMIATVRDGNIVRDQWFFNRNEALEAVGLRE